jgi:hypothetical protein
VRLVGSNPTPSANLQNLNSGNWHRQLENPIVGSPKAGFLFVSTSDRVTLKVELRRTFGLNNGENRQSIGRFNRRVIKKVKINYGK